MKTPIGTIFILVGLFILLHGKTRCFSVSLDFRSIPRIHFGTGKAWSVAYFESGREQMIQEILAR